MEDVVHDSFGSGVGLHAPRSPATCDVCSSCARSHRQSYRCFLQKGLIPIIEREPFVLAPRLNQVMELLLQAMGAEL